MKHEPRKQRRRRNGGVVRAREFGVGQQRVKQPPRQVVPLDGARLFDRLDQRLDGQLHDVRSRNEYLENVDRRLEHGHVVYVAADGEPCVPQAGSAPPPRPVDSWNVVAGRGEAVVKGERVEERQAADANGGGAIFLPVGFGDRLRDGAQDAGVTADPASRLLDRVSDHSRRRLHAVHALEFQRQRPQVVREVGDPPAPNLAFGGGYPSRSVQPPLQAGRPLQRRPRVRLLPDAVGIENAD